MIKILHFKNNNYKSYSIMVAGSIEERIKKMK
jgi:hypothetical protein